MSKGKRRVAGRRGAETAACNTAATDLGDMGGYRAAAAAANADHACTPAVEVRACGILLWHIRIFNNKTPVLLPLLCPTLQPLQL